jgi:phage gp45-like
MEGRLGTYFGTVDEVLAPNNKKNTSKYQYEYIVNVKGDRYAIVPVRCMMMDSSGGGLYNYGETILTVGAMVFVTFPGGDTSVGVIIGAARKFQEKQEISEKGSRFKKRFNEIDNIIDTKGKWSVGHTSVAVPTGPKVELDRDSIKINDGGMLGTGIDAQSVEIDRKSKKITIKAGEWTLDVSKNATINIIGNAKISCLNATIDAKMNVKVSATNAEVTAKNKVTVDAKREVSVKARTIKLNADTMPGDVLTSLTQPSCYVTGIPFVGSQTVKAGS